MVGKSHLCLAERDEELLAQNLPGMCGNSILGLHG
jgi:hypothetical protein